jgi:hypothetical protein
VVADVVAGVGEEHVGDERDGARRALDVQHHASLRGGIELTFLSSDCCYQSESVNRLGIDRSLLTTVEEDRRRWQGPLADGGGRPVAAAAVGSWFRRPGGPQPPWATACGGAARKRILLERSMPCSRRPGNLERIRPNDHPRAPVQSNHHLPVTPAAMVTPSSSSSVGVERAAAQRCAQNEMDAGWRRGPSDRCGFWVSQFIQPASVWLLSHTNQSEIQMWA